MTNSFVKIFKSRVVFVITLNAMLLMLCLGWLTSCSSENQHKAVREETRLVALNYHGIGKYDHLYSVSNKQFTEQVEYLLNQGYSNISLADYRAWRQGTINLPSKVFMLTFDDGNLSDYETVFPFLKEKGLKGLFFLKTTAINSDGYLGVDQIKEMVASGLCEFGSHSASHKNLIVLEKNVLDNELATSKKIIQGIIEQEVYSFAYPNGFWDETAKKTLMQHGYKFAFTVMPGINFSTTDPYELRRIILNKMYSQKDFIAWVEGKPELYRKYYSEMLKKATKDGLVSLANLCKEELLKL